MTTKIVVFFQFDDILMFSTQHVFGVGVGRELFVAGDQLEAMSELQVADPEERGLQPHEVLEGADGFFDWRVGLRALTSQCTRTPCVLCTCVQCKYDFCWVCLETWKKHNSSTGGYFRCNRYEASKKFENENAVQRSAVRARIVRCLYTPLK